MILDTRNTFKPFQYPKLYQLFERHELIHWTRHEITLEFAEDKKDYDHKLPEDQKRFLQELFKFFTQADVDVMGGYAKFCQSFSGCPEAVMLLTSIAGREAVHADAYSALNTAVGMPDSAYSEFMDIAVLRDKHDYVKSFATETPQGLARALALYGLFTEGLQLFASFAMLMNFSRFGVMKGMNKVVTWSIRDEQVHIDACVELYKILCQEYDIDEEALKLEVVETCKKMVELEDAFVDRAFAIANNNVPGINSEDVKQFIRWLANDRLGRIGISGIYNATNPFPWIIDTMYAKEHQNFFEGKGTEYSMGSIAGGMDDLTF